MRRQRVFEATPLLNQDRERRQKFPPVPPCRAEKNSSSPMVGAILCRLRLSAALLPTRFVVLIRVPLLRYPVNGYVLLKAAPPRFRSLSMQRRAASLRSLSLRFQSGAASLSLVVNVETRRLASLVVAKISERRRLAFARCRRTPERMSAPDISPDLPRHRWRRSVTGAH